MLNLLKRKQNEQENPQGKKQKYDKEFLIDIQPQGGVNFKDKYIQKGDGYEACIHIYDYPTTVNELWLEQLMSMRDVIVVNDIATMDKDEAVSSINKSMLEHNVRYRSAKQESERMDAQSSFQEMEKLYQEISQMGEVVKLIQIRIFVYAPTIAELEQKIETIISELNSRGFKGAIFLNETSWEWQSLFLPYEKLQELPNRREGKGLPSLSLASGLPFHYSELNDPKGSYLGTSFTGGNVLFDLFHKDKKRRFYNGVVVGTMGAGKSTTLKKLVMDNASRGNFIRGFDVTGEFETLVNALSGYSISLDGSQGIINPLQIYKTEDTDDSEKDEELSFMRHISKVATFYQFLAGEPTSEEIEEFKKVLRNFYEEIGFVDRIYTTGVTDLPNEEYPIFSDLLDYVKDLLYENPYLRTIRPELSDSKIDRLEKIELVIDNIVNSYSHLFNGYTTIPDFTNEQIIFFSIRNLTGLEKGVFNAQMYNALNLIWDNLIQIGAPQMQALYEDENFDEDEAIRLLVVIDEAHRLINSENMLAVSFLTDFAREARKYFGGLMFASQSIRDFVPDHSDSETVTKIRTLFELTQYKFIMQQDSNTLDSLRIIFEGQLSESELARIPLFQQGDCLLSINGVGNIMLSVEASEEELALFRGGM